MSMTGGCKGFTTIAVLKDMAGLDFGTLEASGLLEFLLFRHFGYFCKFRQSAEIFFYFRRGFLDKIWFFFGLFLPILDSQ